MNNRGVRRQTRSLVTMHALRKTNLKISIFRHFFARFVNSPFIPHITELLILHVLNQNHDPLKLL